MRTVFEKVQTEIVPLEAHELGMPKRTLIRVRFLPLQGVPKNTHYFTYQASTQSHLHLRDWLFNKVVFMVMFGCVVNLEIFSCFKDFSNFREGNFSRILLC